MPGRGRNWNSHRAADSSPVGFCEALEMRLQLSAGIHHTHLELVRISKAESAKEKLAASKIQVTQPFEIGYHNGVKSEASTSAAAGGGYLASQLTHAYGIDQVQDDGGTGAGQTIAIIDAYNDTDIQADLTTFDTAMGLSAPPNFNIVTETGSTNLSSVPKEKGNSSTFGAAGETSLDVEWAHAMAPQANILLIEANSLQDSDLFAGVSWVDSETTYPNVSVVSMSFGAADSSSQESSYNSDFTTPSGHSGITFIASSGDSGSDESGTKTTGVNYPAASPNVLGVGGTSLPLDAASAVISEYGWSESGGGESTTESQPSFQSGVTSDPNARTVPDVSFDADPDTGVAICDSYDGGSSPWIEIGGTSLSSPSWAGLIAIVNQQRVANGLTTLNTAGQTLTLPAIYGLPSSDFHDITSGSNGAYSAGTGYDMVTGRGTPNFPLLLAGLEGQTTKPDLTFTQPSGWSGPIVVTTTSGGLSDGPLISGNTFYLDWNVSNIGQQATSATFHTELLVDGTEVTTWATSSPLASGSSFSVTNYSLGALSTGTHKIELIANYLNEVSETNTTNDTYIRTITVVASSTADLTPYTPSGWTAPVVATTTSGGTTETAAFHTSNTIYIDWAAENAGSSSTPSSGFFVGILVDGKLSQIWSADFVLPSNNYTYATGYSIGELAAGTHTIELLANLTDAAPETTFYNDDYTLTIEVDIPTVATAAAANPSPATGTSTALSVLGADDMGQSNLTYTWATTGTPPAPVTFSPAANNGTNAGQNITANFTTAGTYNFQVTITNTANLSTTSSVTVVVNQTATSINVTPTPVTLAAGATQQYSASAVDQFGHAITSFTWATTGGGTINSSGLFTANQNGGTFSITASSGSVTSPAATVNVVPTVYTAANSYYVELASNDTTEQIWVGAHSGNATYTIPLTSLPSLTFTPPTGTDSLTIDALNNNPVPTGGITFTGASSNANTLTVLGTNNADTFTVNSGAVVFNSTNINFSNVQNLTVDPRAGADSLTVNAGTVNLPAQTTGSGFLLRHFATLSIAANSTVIVGTNTASHPDRTAMMVNSLSINTTGKLDLGGNDMIITAGSTLASITSLLATGFNNGAWNGDGIASSAANASTNHITALGVIVNNTGGNTPIYSSFDGQTGLSSSDIIIKYTYYGDANLDGIVNGTDYGMLDAGDTSHGTLTGWVNGDFNYSTTIDGSDYTLIDNAYNEQTGPM